MHKERTKNDLYRTAADIVSLTLNNPYNHKQCTVGNVQYISRVLSYSCDNTFVGNVCSFERMKQVKHRQAELILRHLSAK